MSNRLTIHNIMNMDYKCRAYMPSDYHNPRFGEDRDLYWIYFESLADDGTKIKENRIHIEKTIHTFTTPPLARYVKIHFNTNDVKDGITSSVTNARVFNMPISVLKNCSALVSIIMMMIMEDTYIPHRF